MSTESISMSYAPFFPLKEEKQVTHAIWYKFTNRPWPDIIEFLVNKLVCITSFRQKNSSFSYHSWVLGRDLNQRPLPPYTSTYITLQTGHRIFSYWWCLEEETQSHEGHACTVYACVRERAQISGLPAYLACWLAGLLPNSCIATEMRNRMFAHFYISYSNWMKSMFR
jgi:hypothetical protein